MYHSISDNNGSFFVKPENFTKQMEYLHKKGYRVISLDELVRNKKKNIPFKGNEVVITFDDGYEDNYKYAYPVLKRFGFPATIFLATDLIGRNRLKFSWEKDFIKNNGYKTMLWGEFRDYESNAPGIFILPNNIFNLNDFEVAELFFMDWDQVREMSEGGIVFGGHTKSHFYLGIIDNEEESQREILGSKNVIEQQTGRPADYFCYPGGGFNIKTKAQVIEAGYKGACSTNRGFSKLSTDLYELQRIKVSNSDINKPFSFWAKLSGYYTVFKKKKFPY